MPEPDPFAAMKRHADQNSTTRDSSQSAPSASQLQGHVHAQDSSPPSSWAHCRPGFVAPTNRSGEGAVSIRQEQVSLTTLGSSLVTDHSAYDTTSHQGVAPPALANDCSICSHTTIDLQTPRDIHSSNHTCSAGILKSASIEPVAPLHQYVASECLHSSRSLRHRRNARDTPDESPCSAKDSMGANMNIDSTAITNPPTLRRKSTTSLAQPIHREQRSAGYTVGGRKHSFSSARINLPPSIRTGEPAFHASVTAASPSILDKGDLVSSKEALLDLDEEARFSWDADEPSSEGLEDKKKKHRSSSSVAGGATDEVCCSHLVNLFPRWLLWVIMNLVVFALFMVPVALHRLLRIQGAFILSGSGSTYTIYIASLHAGYYVTQVLMRGVWRLILLSNGRTIRMKLNGYKVHLSSIGRCIWLSIAIVCWVVFLEVPMCNIARDAHLFEAEGAEEKACRSWGLWWVRQVLVGCLASSCLYIVKTAIVRGIWAHFGQATYIERLETALYHDSILAKIAAFDGIHGGRRRIPSADIRIKSASGVLGVVQDDQETVVTKWSWMAKRVQRVSDGFYAKVYQLLQIFTRTFSHLGRGFFPSSKSADPPTGNSVADHRDPKDHPKNKLNISHLLKKHGTTKKARILFEKICPPTRMYLVQSDFQGLFNAMPEAQECDDQSNVKSAGFRENTDITSKSKLPNEVNANDPRDEAGADSPPPWEKAWQVFDPTGRGLVTRSMFKKTVLSIKRECRNLSLSYTDLTNAIGKLEILINAIFAFLVIVAFLAAFEVAVVQAFTVSISSLVLGCAFVTGSSAKNAFESMIFLFIMRPFDVGDRIEMDGAFYTIMAIHIMTTQLKRGDGLAVFAPNYVLAARFINNLTRSADHVDNIYMDVPLFTTARTIQQLKQRILAFVEGEGSNDYIKIDVILNATNNHTKEGHSRACLQILFRVFHRGKWVDSQYVPRKTRAILFLREALNALEQEDLRNLLELRQSLGCYEAGQEPSTAVNELGREVYRTDVENTTERNEDIRCAQPGTVTKGCQSGVVHSEEARPRLEQNCWGATGQVSFAENAELAYGRVQQVVVRGARPPSEYVEGALAGSDSVSQPQGSTDQHGLQRVQQGELHTTATTMMRPRQLFTQETIQLSTLSANIQSFPNGCLFQR